ncbi:MAG: cation transporter [Phycisphaerae bacterium]|nr:cation transporter [Phycisphaerae bacterium]
MAASGSKLVIMAALIGNGLISITKFIAAGITGSSAMLAEGIHSVVDTGNQVLLLHGLRRSALPPDRRYPFGHGREIYFWSFVVAILIFAVGSGITLYEGISHLRDPRPIEKPIVNYIVLGLAIVFESFAWYFAFREVGRIKGKRGYLRAVKDGKDPSLFVVLFEDTAAMLGLFVALGGLILVQVTGMPIFDGISSILISVILAVTAIWLAIETKSLLIGEAADPETVDALREMVGATDGIDSVHEIFTMHNGPEDILVTISVDFKDDLVAGQLEKTIGSLEDSIRSRYPAIKRIFIEGEAFCRPLPPPPGES